MADSFDALAEAYVRLRPRTDGFEDDARAQILPATQRIVGDVARVAGAVKLFQIGQQGLDELKLAESANAQLGAVIQSTGNAAGISAQHVDDLSLAALKSAGVDNEAAKQADTLLLQLGKFANTDLGHDNFDRASQAAVNLSVRMGTDVPAAAQALAIVLEKPEAGLGRLRRTVGDLSAEQQASIAHFVAVGDSASAQAVILDKLDQAVGGAGAAFGDSLPGKIAIAQESMKNMKGELVAGAAPALSLVADVTTAATAKFAELPEGAQTAVGGIVLIGGAATAIARPLGDVVGLISKFRDAGTQVAESAVDVGTSLNTVATGADAVTSATSAVASGSADLSTDLNTLATGSSAVVTRLAAHTAAAQELTAAEVEQVLAMRGVDEATVEQIASNEALTFSDEEVAAAQTQRLLSNGPLIAAEEAEALAIAAEAEAARLAAVENLALASSQLGISESALAAVLGLNAETGAAEAATAGLSGLATAAAVLAAPAAIVAGLSKVSDMLGVTDDGFTNLQDALKGTDPAFKNFSEDVAGFTGNKLVDDLNKAVVANGDYSKALNDAGATTGELAIAMLTGGDALARFNDKVAHGKNVTDDDRIAILAMTASIDKNAQSALLAAESQGHLDKATLDAAVSQHTAKDGTVDWVAVLGDLASHGAIATGVVKAVTDASLNGPDSEHAKALATWYAAIAKNADDAYNATLKLAPADIRVQRGGLTIDDDKRAVDEANQKLAEAQRAVVDAQAKLDLVKAQHGSQYDIQSAQFALTDAQSALASAQEGPKKAALDLQQAYLDQAGALADLRHEQDAAAHIYDGPKEDAQHYRDALGDLNSTLTGPTHDALAQNLWDMTLLANATERAANLQLILAGNAESLHVPGGGSDAGPRPSNQPGVARVAGGPVSAGETFLGSEQGDELFWMHGKGMYTAPADGFVVPSGDTERVLAGVGASNGGGLTINGGINVTAYRADDNSGVTVARELHYLAAVL